jgi:hypothetical protein
MTIIAVLPSATHPQRTFVRAYDPANSRGSVYECREVHYFACTAWGWAVADNPIDAAERARRAAARHIKPGDTCHLAVFEVPGSSSRGYAIENFMPWDREADKPLDGLIKLWDGPIARTAKEA